MSTNLTQCAELHDLLQNWPASNLLHCYYEIRCEHNFYHYLVKVVMISVAFIIWRQYFGVPDSQYLDDFREYCSVEDRRESGTCLKRTNDVKSKSAEYRTRAAKSQELKSDSVFEEAVFEEAILQPIYSAQELELNNVRRIRPESTTF